LYLFEGLIAGAPVAGLVCFARPRQCGDCHLHWGPPLAKCLLSCRDRAQCWLVVEKAYHVLRRRAPGCDSGLNLGIDLSPSSVDLLCAGACATGERRQRKSRGAKDENLPNFRHGIAS
jgi:hypothetical protein